MSRNYDKLAENKLNDRLFGSKWKFRRKMTHVGGAIYCGFSSYVN